MCVPVRAGQPRLKQAAGVQLVVIVDLQLLLLSSAGRYVELQTGSFSPEISKPGKSLRIALLELDAAHQHTHTLTFIFKNGLAPTACHPCYEWRKQTKALGRLVICLSGPEMLQQANQVKQHGGCRKPDGLITEPRLSHRDRAWAWEATRTCQASNL